MRLNPIATPTNRDTRLPAIQVLRGIAASLVVFHHYSLVLTEFSPAHSWIVDSGLGKIGACGVDIFFAISGFIMVYTTQSKAGVKDALVFVTRRGFRIYPLYWVWSTVLLALWASGFALTSHHYSVGFLITSFLLIPSFNGHSFHPLLDQGWTLSFEMLFYVVFAGCILLRLRKSKLAFLIGSFAMLSCVSVLLPSDSGIRYLLSDHITIEFLYGVLAAEVLLRLPATFTAWWVRVLPFALMVIGCVALLGTVGLEMPDSMRFVTYGLPALLIVFAAAMRGPTPCPRLLVYFGDASYSIYLTHGFFSMAYGMALKHSSLLTRLSSDAAIVAAGIITILLSSLTHLLVERPLTDYFSGRKNAPVPVSHSTGSTSDSSALGNVPELGEENLFVTASRIDA
jgi:exopolysaccharide production protein ExoZ